MILQDKEMLLPVFIRSGALIVFTKSQSFFENSA
jgi:hypothetical protein